MSLLKNRLQKDLKDLVSSLEVYTLHGTNQSEEEEPHFIDIKVGYAYNDDNEMDDSASRQKVAAVTNRLAELGYSGFDDWGDTVHIFNDKDCAPRIQRYYPA